MEINIFEQNTAVLKALASKNTNEATTKKADSEGYSEQATDRIIQMAWEDRTPFEAIEQQFGLKEKQVIEFMRANSKASSFKMWRKRMKSRKTKHLKLRDLMVNRFKCSMQRSTGNTIAKR